MKGREREKSSLSYDIIALPIKWNLSEIIDILFLMMNKLNLFDSLIWFPKLVSIMLTNLNQSVEVQPVIKQVQIFVRREMKKWISISNKNFESILNQLGYFKGQLFGSLIMKYGFSKSMLSFIENDLTYHAKHLRCYFLSIKYENCPQIGNSDR